MADRQPKPEPLHRHHRRVRRKIAALRAHESQTAHRDRLQEEMRERLAPYNQAAGLPADRLVEAFQVVTIT
jgi:hypothetical protein